jgi:hypothetical protein
MAVGDSSYLWLCFFCTSHLVFIFANFFLFCKVLWYFWPSVFKTVVIVNRRKLRVTCIVVCQYKKRSEGKSKREIKPLARVRQEDLKVTEMSNRRRFRRLSCQKLKKEIWPRRLTPWSMMFAKELLVPQVVKIFSHRLWNPNVHCSIHSSPITVFTAAPLLYSRQLPPPHLTSSWAALV